MKTIRSFFQRAAPAWGPLLLGVFLAGCSSMKYNDPVNPTHPYAFPGQAPAAASASETTLQPAAAVAPAPGSKEATEVANAIADEYRRNRLTNSPAAPATAPAGVPVAVMPVIPGSAAPVTPMPVAPAAAAPVTPIPAPTSTAGLPPAVLPESMTVLRSGDTIVLSFSDLPASSQMVPVTTELDKDGKITLPYNVIVYALGKNVRQLEQEIRAEYVPKYFKYLTVTVRPEMRFFHVNGEVKSPSMYPWRGEPTVLRAIGAAGGFTDWAQRKKVQLIRSNGQKFIINCWNAEKDIKKDLPVFPGDYIYVPRKGPFSW